jgi:hypothetical protein
MPARLDVRQKMRDLTPRHLEAILLVILDEFNRERQWAGKPQLTPADMLAAIRAKLAQLRA